MKKFAIALALSLAATSAFAQNVGDDVTSLAPAGTVGAVGQSVMIAGVGTATWAFVGGVLLLVLVAGAGSSTTN